MRALLLFLLLIWGQLFSHGQSPNLYFKSIPAQKQLSSQFTTSITQDQKGYIWIGTIDGLNRYDGQRMKIFRNNEEQNTGLANNNIQTLFADSKNRIWIGTAWGLSIYIPEIDGFKLVSSNENTNGLERSFTTRVSENRNHEILVATGASIYRYNEQTKQFVPVIELEGGEITSFCTDRNNNLWVGQNNGGGIHLFRYDEKYEKEELPQWISTDLENELNQLEITDLIYKDSLLWIASRGKGITQLNIRKQTTQKFLTYDYNAFVIDLYIDKHGALWSCDYAGLKRYNVQNNTFDEYYEEPDGANNVKHNPIKIFQDNQFNYWVLYSEEGLDFASAQRGFQHFDGNPESYWPLGDENVFSIAEDRHGNLWTGGFNGGITVFQWAQQNVTRFVPEEGNPESLAKGSVFDLHLDSRKDMWVATYSRGIQKFNPEINGFISFSHDKNNPESIAGNDIRSIEEDDHGKFWLAVHGIGIDYFNQKTGVFEHYTPKNSNLSIEWTNQVLLDSKNNLWVATSNGLNLKKEGSDVFKVYLSYNSDNPSALKSNDVICLHETPDSSIWVGTTFGLYRYSPETDNFVFHSEDFNNQYICSIEHDNEGKLWVSTHGGITEYNPATRKVFNFDTSDGLQANDFNLKASYRDGNGNLFFGGPGGLNSFDPDNINYNLTPPTVVFTDLQIFNESVDSFGADKPLSQHISYADTVVLDYSDKFFTISFTAINFIQPSKNQYAYKMEGFDSRWHYTGNNSEATFTNLNPGTYTLKVKAANNDGIWNEKGISIKVKIKPPWYMTLWFQMVIIALFFIVIYLVVRIRTRMLRRQKVALIALVNERTRRLHEKNNSLKKRTIELDDINRELENQKLTIQQQADELKKQAGELRQSNDNLQKLNNTKDRLFSVIAHDVRSPFNTIIGFSSILKELSNEGGNNLSREYAGYIYDSSNQVLALMENLLYWARSQTNEISLNTGSVSIRDIFEDNLSLLKESMIKKGIQLDSSGLDFSINFEADTEMMRIVVRNILSNAIKFTPYKGTITLKTEVKKDQLIVSISDSGQGLTPEQIEKIKQPSQIFSTPGTHGEKGSGLGLTVCKEFVERHNGQLIVEGSPGKGSRFGFIFPLAKYFF
ncbi:two-component regulator propeller domain-containing protein [Marinilabilia salmonicolor]|uniref:histidine kinase n=1 Tax=Marinilabilia salmonicolor TaxID=989 RepID=A0A368VEH3_9BACT|nr:sensor histidine kinase [Marinilabilia salmonicolor]RCW38625.1 signal transduction histidine kinase [Marinilabilia salmonicolor]